MDVIPEVEGSKEYKALLENEHRRINNKEYRQFDIYFKSGSFRSIHPRHDFKMTLEIDKKNRVARNWYKNINGATEFFEVNG